MAHPARHRQGGAAQCRQAEHSECSHNPPSLATQSCPAISCGAAAARLKTGARPAGSQASGRCRWRLFFRCCRLWRHRRRHLQWDRQKGVGWVLQPQRQCQHEPSKKAMTSTVFAGSTDPHETLSMTQFQSPPSEEPSRTSVSSHSTTPPAWPDSWRSVTRVAGGSSARASACSVAPKG